MRALRAKLITVLVVVGIFPSCARPDDPSEFLRGETEGLQRRTIPPTSAAVVRSRLTQKGWSETAQWGFETGWDWPRYEAWATSQLRPDFGISHADPSHVVFVRPLRGDTEELTIEAESDGNKLRVTTTFVVYPD